MLKISSPSGRSSPHCDLAGSPGTRQAYSVSPLSLSSSVVSKSSSSLSQALERVNGSRAPLLYLHWCCLSSIYPCSTSSSGSGFPRSLVAAPLTSVAVPVSLVSLLLVRAVPHGVKPLGGHSVLSLLCSSAGFKRKPGETYEIV